MTNGPTRLFLPDRLVVIGYTLVQVCFLAYRALSGQDSDLPWDALLVIVACVFILGLWGLLFSKRWAIWLLAILCTMSTIGIIMLMLRYRVFYVGSITNGLLALYALARLFRLIGPRPKPDA